MNEKEKGFRIFQGRQTRLLLWLGTALIALSGIIFISTAWNTLSDIGKAGLLAAVTTVFGVVSWYTMDRLELKNTGEAFYLLTHLFVGITLFALWYYDILMIECKPEYMIIIYLCWLAAWGLVHENRLLNEAFWGIIIIALLDRLFRNNGVVYPYAVLGAMYLMAKYIFNKKGNLSLNWIVIYLICFVFSFVGLFGRNAAFSIFIVLAMRSLDRARIAEGIKRMMSLTWSLLYMMISFYTQNFFEIPDFFMLEVNLLPLVLSVWTLGYIWEDDRYKKVMDIIRFCVALACMYTSAAKILDINDYYLAEKLFHTVVLGCASLGMIIVSTNAASSTGNHMYRKWQIMGVVFLCGVVLNATWGFWESLGWWFYLLAAGAILIAVAARKELKERENPVDNSVG